MSYFWQCHLLRLLFGVNKKLLIAYFWDLLQSISCFMSATRVGQGLDLELELGSGLGLDIVIFWLSNISGPFTPKTDLLLLYNMSCVW